MARNIPVACICLFFFHQLSAVLNRKASKTVSLSFRQAWTGVTEALLGTVVTVVTSWKVVRTWSVRSEMEGWGRGRTKLQDASVKYITRNKAWQILIALHLPLVTEISCPPLDSVPRMTIRCSDGFRFNSRCEYTCERGFDVASGVTRRRVCSWRGTWIGAEPSCIGKILL